MFLGPAQLFIISSAEKRERAQSCAQTPPSHEEKGLVAIEQFLGDNVILFTFLLMYLVVF